MKHLLIALLITTSCTGYTVAQTNKTISPKLDSLCKLYKGYKLEKELLERYRSWHPREAVVRDSLYEVMGIVMDSFCTGGYTLRQVKDVIGEPETTLVLRPDTAYKPYGDWQHKKVYMLYTLQIWQIEDLSEYKNLTLNTYARYEFIYGLKARVWYFCINKGKIIACREEYYWNDK